MKLSRKVLQFVKKPRAPGAGDSQQHRRAFDVETLVLRMNIRNHICRIPQSGEGKHAEKTSLVRMCGKLNQQVRCDDVGCVEQRRKLNIRAPDHVRHKHTY